MCTAGMCATAAADMAPTTPPDTSTTGGSISDGSDTRVAYGCSAVAKLIPRKPISIVSATVMMSPALAPEAEEMPMRKPSTKASTVTAANSVTGKGPIVGCAATAFTLRPPSASPSRSGDCSVLGSSSVASPSPSSSASSSTSQKEPMRKNTTSAAPKPTPTARQAWRSLGGARMTGTSSVAMADMTIPAARCCSAATTPRGTVTL
mmetsp:Transcript_27133/g.81323  ORF Transcript_27133/g.81323 Transcript_27133/m.81323 type:complete len:206 (+) Transcript_27133:227-844(+)